MECGSVAVRFSSRGERGCEEEFVRSIRLGAWSRCWGFVADGLLWLWALGFVGVVAW